MQTAIAWDEPRHNGTATSMAAAKSMKPHAGSIRSKIFHFIAAKRSYGATADEIEHILGYAGSTLRPRICELREKNMVRDSGITRPTVTGRMAVVWVANAND